MRSCGVSVFSGHDRRNADAMSGTNSVRPLPVRVGGVTQTRLIGPGLDVFAIGDVILFGGCQGDMSAPPPPYRRAGPPRPRERQRRGLSLAALAGRTGVSRSMLSDVERGTKARPPCSSSTGSPGSTPAWSGCSGRSVPTAGSSCDGAGHRLRSPGWERRILSPVLPGVEFEMMRTTIPRFGLADPRASGIAHRHRGADPFLGGPPPRRWAPTSCADFGRRPAAPPRSDGSASDRRGA